MDISFFYLDELNKYVDTNEPWKLIKTDEIETKKVLYTVAELLRQVWLNLYCFFPQKMSDLFEKIGLENYREQLEDGKLEELRNKIEIFNITEK